MVDRVHSRFLLVLSGSCMVAGCSFLSGVQTAPESPVEAVEPQIQTEDTVSENPEDPEPSPESPPAQPTPAAIAAPPQNYFQEAINRAQSAVSLGQSAQSPNDWQLIEGRWQQAVRLMQQVPEFDPNYATAQQKVTEYQQNAVQAAQRAAGQATTALRRVSAASSAAANGLVTHIPILERAGGTPVVSVELTGNSGAQTFPMLFDTGANITLITPAMANQVGVLVVNEITVTVADGRQVQMPVGYVDTLTVGELVLRDILVGIGGDVGLLGQDVYGDYGISVGGNRISLYE